MTNQIVGAVVTAIVTLAVKILGIVVEGALRKC